MAKDWAFLINVAKTLARYRDHLGGGPSRPKCRKESETRSLLAPKAQKSQTEPKRVKIVNKLSILTRFRLHVRGSGNSVRTLFATFGPEGAFGESLGHA